MGKKSKELSSIDEELLAVTSSKKKKGKKKHSDSEDEISQSSESESSSSSEEETQKISESQKPLKKRKQNPDADDAKEQEFSEDEEFDDGLDEDLFENEEDRKRLLAMSEVQREEIMFERSSRRKELKDKWELKRKLKMEKRRKAGLPPTPATPGSRSSQRSKTTSKKLEKAEALKDLRMRKEKGRTNERFREESSSESSSSEDEKPKKQDESEDEKPQQEEQPSEEDIPISLEHAKRLCLKREYLEKIVDEPYFDAVCNGMFVRIGIGASPDGKPTYRMAEICNSYDGEKTYKLGTKATKKLLELKIGGDKTRKVYSMETISNHSVTDSEFQKWAEVLQQQKLPLLTVRRAKEKFAQFVESSKNHTYNHEEVDVILQKKRELNLLPTNFSQRVKELEYALRIAMDEVPKNAEKIQQIQSELDDARKNVKHIRSKNLDSMTKITQKNKSANQDAKPYESVVSYADADHDPFSRRRTNPNRVVVAKKEEVKAEDKNNKKDTEHKEKLEVELTAFVEKHNPEQLMKAAHHFELDIPLGIAPAPKELPKKQYLDEPEQRKQIPKKLILTVEDYKHRINKYV